MQPQQPLECGLLWDLFEELMKHNKIGEPRTYTIFWSSHTTKMAALSIKKKIKKTESASFIDSITPPKQRHWVFTEIAFIHIYYRSENKDYRTNCLPRSFSKHIFIIDLKMKTTALFVYWDHFPCFNVKHSPLMKT